MTRRTSSFPLRSCLNESKSKMDSSDSISISDINLTASGTHDDYQAEVTASLTAPQIGHAQLESSGRGTLSEFRIEDVRALALRPAKCRGSGAISWQASDRVAGCARRRWLGPCDALRREPRGLARAGFH